MLTRKSIASGLAAVLLGGAAIVGLTGTVSAATCQGNPSSTWNTTQSTTGKCGTRDARSIGTNSHQLNATLKAQIVSGGVHAFAFGVDVNGSDVPGCFATDENASDGLPGPGDSSGCATSFKHRPTVVF